VTTETAPRSDPRLAPYPHVARARCGDLIVAESGSCLVLDDGRDPVVFFPNADIRFDRLSLDGTRSARAGLGEGQRWGVTELDGTPGERGVLWEVHRPPLDLRRLEGHGAFDQDRVIIEVVDGRPGDAARDVTIRNFPVWGDTGDLLDLLDVRRQDVGRFVSATRNDARRLVVEGSQMLGQGIVAASRAAPQRRVVSANMVFTRAADSRVPLTFELGELTDGKIFTAFAANVRQSGRLCASGVLLLGVTSDDVIRHGEDPPAVPGPYQSPAYDMGVIGRDLRVVDGAYVNDSATPVGPPVVDCWVRYRDVPADPALHAGLLAQFTGHMPIAAALRPHKGIGQDQAHRTLSMAINAISISFHDEIHADQWLLYHHRSTFAGAGMTHAECRVHTESGTHVASFSVDAMVRAFEQRIPTRADDRTAL